MRSLPESWALVGTAIFVLFLSFSADAHLSGCHRWHSCPSDRGTYTCGDKGSCSACPDNRFCLAGQPRSHSEPPRPKAEQSPEVVQEFSGKVVGVADGDTITVLHHGRAERIIPLPWRQLTVLRPCPIGRCALSRKHGPPLGLLSTLSVRCGRAPQAFGAP